MSEVERFFVIMAYVIISIAILGTISAIITDRIFKRYRFKQDKPTQARQSIDKYA